MDISIVIPLYNEEESLPELAEWINRVMLANGYSFEAIFVDDGSSDNSWNVIQALADKFSWVKGLSFRRNYGKSAALNEGFKAAQGDVVITMDADLQDSPDEIPELYRLIKEEKYDLISGWKQKRHDPLSKTIPTKLFNWATRKMSGINNLHDFNCGLKSYKRDVVKSIEVYGEMHRYIPVLAKWAGFKKIGEKPVQHQARKYGTTKFGLERFINGFLDLMTITFVSKFGRRPMHFFGTMGFASFMLGILFTIYLVIYKLYHIAHGMHYRDITDKPSFYIALVAIVIGVQLFMAGFLGELISRSASERNHYHIKDTLKVN
jgi:glycosyltransferase involved in cell wall biosynthesis